MFKFFRYRSKYGAYLKNEEGIKKFAEMTMGKLLRKVTKKSAFYREMNENMLVEKANLRMRRDELYEQPTLSSGDFFSTRRRLWAETLIIVIAVLAAIFLNSVSASSFIDTGWELGNTLRWIAAVMVAIVLTGGGMIIAEQLIDALITKHKSNPEKERSTVNHFGLTLLWAVLLVAIEIAIVGIAQTEAATRAGGEEANSLVYMGYIITSMILPLVAGALRWHSMRSIDPYKTTMVLRQIESRLAQIDSVLRQNDEYESNFYKIKSIEGWDEINDFKTYKDNINRRNDIEEPVEGHFAESYDAFQSEAYKRYEMDLRDMTSKSMRKLELVDADRKVGSKIGQEGKVSSAAKMRPASAPPSEGSPNGETADDDYMKLKPIR